MKAIRYLLLLVLIVAVPVVYGQTGSLVGSVMFASDCTSGLGVGITYDGTNLWYSCYNSTTDLYRADPITGAVTASYSIANGLGSLAYDAANNIIWAGEGGGNFSGAVIKITLDASKNVTGHVAGFPVPEAFNGVGGIPLDDGLGIDGTTNILYISYDVSTSIYKYDAVTGAFIGSFPWAGDSCYNSGVAIGGNLLFQGSDGCSHVWVVDKTTLAPAFDFSTAVAGDPNFRDESLTCDPKTFFPSLGKEVMWSKEAYSPMRAHAFEIPLGTCASGGQPPSCVSFSPPTIDFGNVRLNQTKKVALILTNNCTAKVVIGAVSFTNVTGDPADFSSHEYCNAPYGGKLKVGHSCQIQVFFSADEVGTDTATLNVAISAPGSAIQVPVTATEK